MAAASDHATPPPASHTRALAALDADELARTRSFLWVSGALATVGALGALVLGGNPWTRALFVCSVLVLLCIYVLFGWHIQRPANYSPVKALVAVTGANMSGVAAALHFGLYSPAPMVLMVPIAYFGMSNSGMAALVASAIMAGALALPSLAVALGLVTDPGMITSGDLSTFVRFAYIGLVQVVLGSAFVLARTARRATRNAVISMEAAVAREEVALAQVREAHALLDEARAGRAEGPMAGQQLGDWALGALMGRGGSGDVYEARHAATRVRAAAKVMHAELLRDPLARTLTEREARLLAEIDSPYVVRVYDFSLTPRPYLVMEYLDGTDLGAVLRAESRLDAARVKTLVIDVSAGLEVLHARGVVHRDVKPANLFGRSQDGRDRWKLLDLGVSTSGDGPATVTRGLILGTPGYMSPEQVYGSPLDARSDQFSLAAVVYRSLTGRPAFQAANHHASLLLTTESQPPRPSSLVPLPPGVDAVLAVGLSKRPGGRFGSVSELSTELCRALEGHRSYALERRAVGLLSEHPWAVG